MPKRFQKNVEDFACENCGFLVKGGGYTNHCPHCLWSKHVDIDPGDRSEICLGLMKPVALMVKGNKYIIKHRCLDCGLEKNNKSAAADDLSTMIDV